MALGPNGQKFGSDLTSTILSSAKHYKHRPRRLFDGKPTSGFKGDIIRARIAANAQRRFEIAEAMKREAGVVGHDLIGERKGGIAWTDRARILAPEGENRVQLATLAHECGHVFLHSAGTPGAGLAPHIMEMEAESYAHQAFAAHGMRMPIKVSHWGRRYVAQWIEADRADGIRIDQRAIDYASGKRSPYAHLRLVPTSWPHIEAPEGHSMGEVRETIRRIVDDGPSARTTAEKKAVRSPLRQVLSEALDLASFTFRHMFLAVYLSSVCLMFRRIDDAGVTIRGDDLAISITVGWVWMFVALLFKLTFAKR